MSDMSKKKKQQCKFFSTWDAGMTFELDAKSLKIRETSHPFTESMH